MDSLLFSFCLEILSSLWEIIGLSHRQLVPSLVRTALLCGVSQDVSWFGVVGSRVEVTTGKHGVLL